MKLLLLLIATPLFIARFLRWLSIVQQKEYRLDRLKLFLNSSSGTSEIFLLPKVKHFTRTGLKRSVITLRSLVVGIISLFFLFPVLWLSIFAANNFTQSIIFLLVAYLLTPLAVFLAMLITSPALQLVTTLLLGRAKNLLAQTNPTIIGITGSYGKTSTKLILTHLLSQKYSVFSTPKSFNTKYSIARSILQGFTEQKFVILEYGAYKIGEIKELTEYFSPKIAIITGVTSQHLGLFGSLDNLIQAKSELVRALPKDGVVFCNADDKNAVRICEKSKVEVIKYSGTNHSQILKNIRIDAKGRLFFELDGEKVETKIIGKHYVSNIKAAIAVSQHFGLSNKEVVAGLKSFIPSDLFIKVKTLKTGVLIIDDSGTSNPKGFEATMDLSKSINKTEKILIFGGIVDLGEESTTIHRGLAKEARKVFLKVLYTGLEGKTEFRNEFGKKLIDNNNKIENTISLSNKNTLILVEGRIPKSISSLINKT